MKSFGQLLEELGFNEDAPLSAQKAFFKHLANQAESSRFTHKAQSLEDFIENEPKKMEQLSFDLSDTDPNKHAS